MRYSQFTSRCLVLTLCASSFVPVLLASKNFVKPVARTAINYPAHDFHRDEKAAIAADPYDTPEKARIFSVDFAAHGFLPVFFVVSNDGDQPISIANMAITLTTAHHSKLTQPTDESALKECHESTVAPLRFLLSDACTFPSPSNS